MGGKSSKAVEWELARLASKAHGVVTRAGMLRLGITAKQIEKRLEKGVLIPIYRGVYRVGHGAPSIEALYMAAVLACGKGAVLSGRAAASLFGLLKGGPPPPEVTTRTQRRVRGVRTRRARVATTTWRGIPITTVAQTLVDLAPYLPDEDLARAVHEAHVRHRTTPPMVEAVLARYPNAPGAGKLKRVLRGEAQVLLSKLERGFNRHMRTNGLDLPKTNIPAGAHYVDCRWPDKKLTVELDSFRYHNTRYSWEQDRQREREARARGDDFRRYTWHDVYVEPRPMVAEMRALLSRRRIASARARSG